MKQRGVGQAFQRRKMMGASVCRWDCESSCWDRRPRGGGCCGGQWGGDKLDVTSPRVASGNAGSRPSWELLSWGSLLPREAQDLYLQTHLGFSCHIIAMVSWTSYSTSLSLSFLTSNMEDNSICPVGLL